MKLCIQQKVFSWSDRFSVKDESGEDRYFAEGEVFSWGKRLHIYAADGAELALLREKVFSLLSTYFVEIDGVEAMKIVKEFTFFKPVYTVEPLGWTVKGDLFEHDYEIESGETAVARVSKEWFTWGDCYAIDISEGADELSALAVVLAIDCAMARQND